jgi:hypothetical protein
MVTDTHCETGRVGKSTSNFAEKSCDFSPFLVKKGGKKHPWTAP